MAVWPMSMEGYCYKLKGREMAEISDSSDSDVELIRPRYVKRRRILPATLPVTVSVYSNKVNSCLKLLPKDSSELVQLAEELERVKDSEDLENEGMFVPPAAQPQKSPLYDLTDSEGEGGEPEAARERLRDASPSPPPTPQTPVRKRGRAYNQIRDLDAQLKDLGTDLSPSHRSVTENDLILVGSSPAPELTVKVRRGGELFRINIRMLDPLQNLAQSVASKLGVEASQILLLLRDEELALTQTAQSLSLTVADIIDCVVLSTSSEQADIQSDDTICLQVQGKEKQSHLSITVGKTEPLQSLIDQYHAATGLPKRGKVSFMFEGKKLQGKSTAEELGLETDDIIEVWL
ncbi:NFATC2-interacting protein [Bombina bombina]|uniref:NFATC2-interacting protein n=1 Tax=Bombina bombina TaxID=8345 RepID=UPI00235A63E6|nr:NFATC2-interacting protein [Bombina bombina]